MNLTKYITRNCVVPDLKASNKSDALTEITTLLFERRKLGAPKQALVQIFAREITESTGIGRGIAVPHARVAGLKGLVCAVARIPKGIDFMALDKQPVHIIFLICYPPQAQTQYLNFVATVAKLLSDSEHLQALIKAGDDETMYQVLETAGTSFEAVHQEYAQEAEETGAMADSQAGLVLLARLQFYQEVLAATRTGKTQVKESVDSIRALLDPKVLSHYDRLSKSRPPALVPVEGDTCQGCFMKLPSKFVQKVREDSGHLYTCPNCSRYIYVV